MLIRLRLLPFIMIIGFMMLCFKAYDIGKTLNVEPGTGFALKESQAQAGDVEPVRLFSSSDSATVAPVLAGSTTSAITATPAAVTSAPSAEQERQFAQAATGQEQMTDGQPLAPGGQQSANRDARSEPGTPPLPAPTRLSEFLADPDSLTPQELELLLKLAQRRDEIEERERVLNQREAELLAVQQRVDEKISELKALQTQIEGLLVEHETQTEAQLVRLINIYSTMKPKDAANVFKELDIGILVDLVGGMRERKAAPILADLAKLDAIKAKQVTEVLAERRKLPVPKE